MGCGLVTSTRNTKAKADTSSKFSFSFCKNLPSNLKNLTSSTKRLTVIFEVKSQLEFSSIVE